jgi:hypothetical protein
VLRPGEPGPAGAVPARCRIGPRALTDLPDRGRRHAATGPGGFCVDPAVTPRLVLPGQPQHRRPDMTVRRRAARLDMTVRRWAAGPALAREARPAAAADVAMPADDGARSHDRLRPGPALDGQRPGQRGRPCPVWLRHTRRHPRPLTLRDDELMGQHQDPGVLPPRLPARQPEQRHETGDDQEGQLQARKPKIVPPADRPRHARPAPEHGTEPTAICRASAQVTRVFGTHSLSMSSRALYVGSTSTRPATSSGCLTASAEATTPPIECPEDHSGLGRDRADRQPGRGSAVRVQAPARISQCRRRSSRAASARACPARCRCRRGECRRAPRGTPCPLPWSARALSQIVIICRTRRDVPGVSRTASHCRANRAGHGAGQAGSHPSQIIMTLSSLLSSR